MNSMPANEPVQVLRPTVPVFRYVAWGSVIFGASLAVLAPRPERPVVGNQLVQDSGCRAGGMVAHPDAARQLVSLALRMERIADSARRVVRRSEGGESEFEGAVFFASAADIGEYAAALAGPNSEAMFEASRLQLRVAVGGEGLIDTTRLRLSERFLTCARAFAVHSRDSTVLRRSDSLSQVIDRVRSGFGPRR